ncbi:hypothetical protein BN1080_02195 [Planococcus massiliensis]|uniref:Uncharacterized protein n=1 Tax=Planococcus massiliensis TaxID=1499687 RepID=A0A098EN54_9BACL|nr:hypothetical protein BN1080_02195 [Planococcus massiliensis]
MRTYTLLESFLFPYIEINSYNLAKTQLNKRC